MADRVGRRYLASPRRAGKSAEKIVVGKQGNDDDSTLLRSWIAISLVAGLLVFCAVAFAVNDESLRSTLFGGLVTSVGAAIAFYFSSKSADQARQDLLKAGVGTTSVPDLVGTPPHRLTLADARAAIAPTQLVLVVDDPTTVPDALVVSQSPPAHTQMINGSNVSVSTEPPPDAAKTLGTAKTPADVTASGDPTAPGA
ncbi:MAG: hypothetical protein ACLPUG_00735 [Acidimicrobiales bacterium]|jgi:hypothetical protein